MHILRNIYNNSQNAPIYLIFIIDRNQMIEGYFAIFYNNFHSHAMENVSFPTLVMGIKYYLNMRI